MADFKTLTRNSRIRMFLSEYYYGYSFMVTVARTVSGPLLICAGIYFYYHAPDRFTIAFGGFGIVYGSYYALKPFLWILFRLDSFKTISLAIAISDDRILVKDNISESEILFRGIPRIRKRQGYYTLEISKYQKVYLPFNYLTDEGKALINSNLTDRTN